MAMAEVALYVGPTTHLSFRVSVAWEVVGLIPLWESAGFPKLKTVVTKFCYYQITWA